MSTAPNRLYEDAVAFTVSAMRILEGIKDLNNTDDQTKLYTIAGQLNQAERNVNWLIGYYQNTQSKK